MINKEIEDAHQTNEPEPEFRMLKDAGHCANMDRAEDFNKILSKFIHNRGKK
jgi:hypothetical protein